MPPRKAKTVEPSFEEGLKQLEQMAEMMEQNQLPLEEMLVRYQEGMKLSKMLEAKLEKAKADIQVLMTQGTQTQWSPLEETHQPTLWEDET